MPVAVFGNNFGAAFKRGGLNGDYTGVSLHLNIEDAVRFELRGFCDSSVEESKANWPEFLRGLADCLESAQG